MVTRWFLSRMRSIDHKREVGRVPRAMGVWYARWALELMRKLAREFGDARIAHADRHFLTND